MLVEELKRSIEERRESDAEKGFHLNPSGLGRCPREILLQLIGAYTFEPDDLLYSIFSDGNLHEEQTIREFEKAGVEVVGKQVPFLLPVDNLKGKIFFRDLSEGCRHCGMTYPGHVIHGHMDFVVRHKGKDIVVEHKAVGNSVFADVVKACESYADPGSFLFRAFRPYFVQLGIYLKSAKESLNGNGNLVAVELKNPVIGMLFFKNRNNSQKLEIVVEYDDDFDMLRIVSLTTFPDLVKYNIESSQPRFFERIVELIENIYLGYEVVKKYTGEEGEIDRESLFRSGEWREVMRKLIPHKNCFNCDASGVCSEWFEFGLFDSEREHGKQKQSVILDPETVLGDEKLKELYELYKMYEEISLKLKELSEIKSEIANKMLALMDYGKIYRVPELEKYFHVTGGWEKFNFSKSKLDPDEFEELKQSKFWKAFSVSKSGYYVKASPIQRSKYDK